MVNRLRDPATGTRREISFSRPSAASLPHSEADFSAADLDSDGGTSDDVLALWLDWPGIVVGACLVTSKYQK